MPSVLLAAARLLAPAPLLAQGQQCVFQIDNVDRQGAVVETPQGTNYFAGGNVRLSCRGTKISMQSDSVAAYGGNVVQFIGRVKYRDSTLTMDADRGTYFKNRERWEARGKVVTKNLVTGSTLTGPSLDYMRVVKGVRDTMEMFATGRPTIQYFPSDTGGQKAEPYVIVGDRVRLKGDDRIFAGGKVTVDRSDFASRSDSLRLDTGPGGDGSLIGGRPVLRGLGADSFSITGNRIDLKLEGRELTYLLAKGNGKAVNKEWELVADTIALDVNHRKLEQTLAWGDSLRPSATSTSYAMKADSLALDTPGPAAPGGARLRAGLARRHGLRAHQGPRLDAGGHGHRQVRGARLGRHPTRRAQSDRGPQGRPVLSPGAQRARADDSPRSTTPGATSSRSP